MAPKPPTILYCQPLPASEKNDIMSFIEEFIGTLFTEVLWASIKRFGSFIRWLFLRTKYSYKDIYKQDWNGRIGVFTIAVIVILLIGLNSKSHNSKNRIDNKKKELQQLSNNVELKNGDLIFQTSLSEQSKAIQLATGSEYSHCGIIYIENGHNFVFEAIQPVKTTPLDKWIARGKDGHYVIKRLKNADQVLTTETLQKMKQEGEKFKGKNYDLTFEWSDDKIYCSELIWKIYQRATGVKKKMKERYGNKIPMDEIVISPAAIFENELLTTVKSN